MRYRQKNLTNGIRNAFTIIKGMEWLFLILMISQAACSQKMENDAAQTTHKQVSEKANNHFQKSVDGLDHQKSGTPINRIADTDVVSQVVKNAVRDLGNGFLDHGVAVPMVTSRGTVAAVDKQGHNLILSWLYDHRGTYSLLLIDTNSGKSEQFSLPFAGDSFTSLLSSSNRYYTHFNGHFIEFDPIERDFSFIGKTSAGTAMSMTEDDEGIIWAALRPNCSLISYNPKTQKLTEYGSLNTAKGRQQARSIAADNKGWIYVTAGTPGKEKIVAFNPETKKSRIVQKNAKGSSGDFSLYRRKTGEVFGTQNKKVKMELRNGARKNVRSTPKKDSKRYITGNQALYHRTFPDGTRIMDYVSSSSTGFLGAQEVTIKNKKTGQSRTVSFDYKTEGANLMGLATSPNGKIVGGSTFPMIFFRYDPEKGEWDRRGSTGQANTLTTQGDQVFIGTYNDGALLEWNPAKKWIPTNQKKKGTNPQYLTEAYPYISRPHDLLAYPDGKTIILAGRPSGKRIGGGLLFWNRDTGKADVLKVIDGLQNQSTQSLVALPDGKILGGTTIKPGDSGGKRVATKAVLYIMDLKSKKVEWKGVVIRGARNFQDLCMTSNGLVLGVGESEHFFVFDPKKRKIVKRINLVEKFGSKIPYTQGQRSFIKAPDGEVYLLLQNGILRVDPKNNELSLLAKAPQKITGGGAYLNGRIYYTGGGRNRIHSYTLPDTN